jgi:uncharacterized protein
MHDKHRVYKDGRGSYDDVAAAVQLATKSDVILGTLSVIDPQNDARDVYCHLRGLGVVLMDFLLPDCCYANAPLRPIAEYGSFLCSLFDEWIREDNPKVNIRILSSIIKVFLGGKSGLQGIGPRIKKEPVTVFSNGDLSPADDYCLIGKEVMWTGCTLDNASLKDLFETPSFRQINLAAFCAPNECEQCRWKKVCFGGNLQNRYSKEDGFLRKSIYCEALSMVFEHIENFLINQRVPSERINKILQN